MKNKNSLRRLVVITLLILCAVAVSGGESQIAGNVPLPVSGVLF